MGNKTKKRLIKVNIKQQILTIMTVVELVMGLNIFSEIKTNKNGAKIFQYF